MELTKNIKEKLISYASRFEDSMRGKGFTIGDLEMDPMKRFYTNGKYPSFIGFRGVGGENDYVHCGSSCSLGLRYPVISVDFLYLNEDEIKRFLGKEGEGVLAGLGDIGEIELSAPNPGYEMILEASKLVESVDGWMKQNGKKVDLKLVTSFYRPYLLN